MAPFADWQLERYRPLLLLLVRQFHLDPRLHRRFDSSDLVQETLLRAHQHLKEFRGHSEGELVKWLQEILANAMTDEVRKATAQKRDVLLEQSLQAVLADSSSRLEAYLSVNQPSPSQQAERQELLLRIAAALEQLPDDQRDVLIQRDLQGSSVTAIAAALGKSEKAIAGLLLRGRRKLRTLLQDDRPT